MMTMSLSWKTCRFHFQNVKDIQGNHESRSNAAKFAGKTDSSNVTTSLNAGNFHLNICTCTAYPMQPEVG